MLALVATLLLSLTKMVVALLTGSVGVLSEAIHSALDLVSSVVTFFVVRHSVRPADWDHPFGHGKMESISALFEAFLLFLAGGYVAFEGVTAWLEASRGQPRELVHLGWGVAVIGASILVNIFVYLQNRHVAKSEESIAIETNAFHFLTDCFSSLAVFVSLGVVYFTGWIWVDAASAVFIALYIFAIGVGQIRKCIDELSDTTLPQGELKDVESILGKFSPRYLNYHELRTRKSGPLRYVDLHLTLCSELTVGEAHKVCDDIEDDIGKRFKSTDINIHVEPCGNHGPACESVCEFRHAPRKRF